MKVELSPQQINNIIALLNRANITGNEADEIVRLKIILARSLQRPTPEGNPDLPVVDADPPNRAAKRRAKKKAKKA